MKFHGFSRFFHGFHGFLGFSFFSENVDSRTHPGPFGPMATRTCFRLAFFAQPMSSEEGKAC